MPDPLYLAAAVMGLATSSLVLFVRPPFAVPGSMGAMWAGQLIIPVAIAVAVLAVYVENATAKLVFLACALLCAGLVAFWVTGEDIDEDGWGDGDLDPEQPQPPSPDGADWDAFERWRLDWEAQHRSRQRERALTPA